MEIRPLDAWDADEMARYYAIMRDASLHEREDAPMWGEQDVALTLKQDDPAERIIGFVAMDGDTMVGAGLLALTMLDNTEKAFIEAYVAPPLRRRGIGTAIVDHLVAEAGEGRTTLIAGASYPFERRDDHPYRLFAEATGFRVSLTEVRRDLPLPIDQLQFEAWLDESAAHHDGYRLETFESDIPADLLESFLYVFNQIGADMPHGDAKWEASAVDAATWAQQVRNAEEADRRDYFTVAISPDGEVVAFSTLVVPAEDMPTIHQWGTMVRADHRGKRLGMAVKAANLRHVQALHPERTRVTTCNAEVNAQMVDINERLGFQAVEIKVEFQRDL